MNFVQRNILILMVIASVAIVAATSGLRTPVTHPSGSTSQQIEMAQTTTPRSGPRSQVSFYMDDQWVVHYKADLRQADTVRIMVFSQAKGQPDMVVERTPEITLKNKPDLIVERNLNNGDVLDQLQEGTIKVPMPADGTRIGVVAMIDGHDGGKTGAAASGLWTAKVS